MKKIIFVNRFYYPDQSATSQILSDLLDNIESQIEAEFHVITSRQTYQNDADLNAFEIHNNINIHRVWTTSFGRDKLLGRALDYLSFYVTTFIILLKLVKKNDVVIAKTDPPVISFVSYVVTKVKRAYLINWLQDLFPEVAGELGLVSVDSVIYRLLKKIKNISLKAAKVNVVIGEKMAGLVKAQGVNQEAIEVIRNWNVNERVEFVPKKNNHLVRLWGLENKFVVSYSGNFGRAHEYGPIKKLVTDCNDNDIVFLFIGGGKYYDDLKQYAEDIKLRNVLFQPYQDRKDLNHSLSVADIHLISLIPSLEGLIVPSKFYGIASIGIPVLFIGDKDGEIGQVIRDNSCGYVISPDDYKDIVEVIKNIKSNKDKLKNISWNLSKLYDDEYKPKFAYQKWRDILCDFI